MYVKPKFSLYRLLKVVFYLPGTIAHELLHYIFALLFARDVTRFNVMPNFQEGTAGSVHYRSRNGASSILISFAPKLYWVFLIYFLSHVSILSLDYEGLSCTLDISHVNWRNPLTLASVYLITQFIWAGTLSTQDWKNIFQGAFTVSGLLLIFVTAIVSIVLIKNIPLVVL